MPADQVGTTGGFAEYTSYDALGLAELVRKKEVTPAELVDAAISRIEAVNPKLNAVIYKAYDYGRKIAAGPVPDGPFQGVPFLLKELATMWEGMPTTNSCKYFKDFVAPLDFELVTRIKRAGFILVGKTNAPDNGWALTTEPEMYGRTHNPWNETVTPGGSSGGSAAAVAARLVPLAEGSDGAGSIRVPAANTGIVGLKPSRGRNTIGPIYVDYWFGGAVFLCVSRTVRDTAAYLDATSGALPGEPYAPPPLARPFLDEAGRDPGRFRIGFTTTAPDGNPVHPEAVEAVRGTAKLLEELGHDVDEHDMDFDAAGAWLTYTRMTAVQTAMGFEASIPLVGHPVREDEVSPTIWATIQRGKGVGGVQHTGDIEALRNFSRQIATDLAAYDIFLTPTLTHPPRPFGYWDMSESDIDAYNAKWTDGVFMFPFNISGQPAMSVPMHWTADGLPMGVQLVGRNHDEASIIRLAAQLEQARPWADLKPPISA